MPTISIAPSAKTQVTVTNFPTLASATYAVSNAYTASINAPLDLIVEVEAETTNTPSGNKQLILFAKASLDGTNYQTGPESGTTTTNEPDMTLIDVLPMLSAPVVTAVTGTSGQATIVLTSATGINPGDRVSGTGIASGATVVSIATLTATLSANNTGTVSGNGTFFVRHRKAFSLIARQGFITQNTKFVVKNDLGVTLTDAKIYVSEVVGNSA